MDYPPWRDCQLVQFALTGKQLHGVGSIAQQCMTEDVFDLTERRPDIRALRLPDILLAGQA
jgi:hypothetical protein